MLGDGANEQPHKWNEKVTDFLYQLLVSYELEFPKVKRYYQQLWRKILVGENIVLEISRVEGLLDLCTRRFQDRNEYLVWPEKPTEIFGIVSTSISKFKSPLTTFCLSISKS